MRFCAEIGSLHEGSLERALDCIYAASRSGATDVKFQLLRADSLYPNPDDHTRTQQYHLPLEWIPALSEYARRCGVFFGVSVFAEDLVEPLRRYVDWVKISAYDLPYTDLVQKAAGLGCPVVLSTAMATGDEIDAAIEAVWKTRGGLSPLPMTEKEGVITLLHGTAAYPAPLNQANLKAIETLLIEYPECRIGLSDHTLSAEAAMIATAMGAEFFEVHFRLDDSDPMTPDYANARTPLQFSQYVNTVYRAKEMLGSGDKIGPEWVEMPLFVAARRSNEKRLRG